MAQQLPEIPPAPSDDSAASPPSPASSIKARTDAAAPAPSSGWSLKRMSSSGSSSPLSSPSSSSYTSRASAIFRKKPDTFVYNKEKYGEVNIRFLKGCQMDEVEAQKRWVATCDWREREKIDTILSEIQPHYATVKRLYPHFYHRRARNGNYVYYERPGLSNIKELLKTPGIDIPVVVRHYAFTSEWMWSICDPRIEGKLVSVWDITGVRAGDLFGDTLKLMKSMMAIMQAHCPERSEKLFIINAPNWFASMWRLVSPLLDPNTRKKIDILNKDSYQEALFKWIAPDQVPIEFGGTDTTPLGQSPEEVAMRAHVDALAEGWDGKGSCPKGDYHNAVAAPIDSVDGGGGGGGASLGSEVSRAAVNGEGLMASDVMAAVASEVALDMAAEIAKAAKAEEETGLTTSAETVSNEEAGGTMTVEAIVEAPAGVKLSDPSIVLSVEEVSETSSPDA